jgi:hypothetical protein
MDYLSIALLVLLSVLHLFVVNVAADAQLVPECIISHHDSVTSNNVNTVA